MASLSDSNWESSPYPENILTGNGLDSVGIVHPDSIHGARLRQASRMNGSKIDVNRLHFEGKLKQVQESKEIRMKIENRLALLCLTVAAASAPAFAQPFSPQCGPANFDQSLNAFTIVNPVEDAVNQQCFITVYPRGSVPDQSLQFPAFYPIEGTYVIEISGGGGGGGGGASKDQGGGGGGAGAAPSRTVQYLAPGVYKMTIGTGGEGGSANGGWTKSGNPSSLTNADTGQLVVGFQGADVWTQRGTAGGEGLGGVGTAGGSTGGSGGGNTAISSAEDNKVAESGSRSATAGYSGKPGKSGTESGRTIQTNAGGGGGASVGSGGSGESANRNSVAGTGEVGGGGGGGRGGVTDAKSGGRGGHGFIRLTMSQPAAEPVIVVQIPGSVTQKHSISIDQLSGFGKSSLKPGGEAKLDELVTKLREVNVDRITVTGHADRIGSTENNQQLSVRRAELVKSYLVSRGVQSNLITVVGMGDTQPITGADDCKGPATPKVIACLAPDRRIDIEAEGTDKVLDKN